MKGKIVYNPILQNMLNPLVLETYVEGNRTLKDSIKIPEVIGIQSIEYVRTNPSGDNVYSIKLTNGLSYEIIAPKGDDGVGVLSVKFTRTESNGDRVYTIKLNNGTNFEFVCPKGSPGTTNYNELSDKPFIPTKVSELQNDSGYTTSQQVQQQIANLVNSAPQTLDTLKELADALNNDPNFAATIATQIGQKYTKPQSGIPASDLSYAVQNSLNKADTSQPLLVSGTNIKTINNQSLLGSGNLDISGGVFFDMTSQTIGNTATRTYNFTWSDLTTAIQKEEIVKLDCRDLDNDLNFFYEYSYSNQLELSFIGQVNDKYYVLTLRGDSNNQIVESAFFERRIQSRLTFDSYPTQRSNNPVTSDGIYTALQDIADSISAGQVNADWNASSGVAQILNKPLFTRQAEGAYYIIDNHYGLISENDTNHLYRTVMSADSFDIYNDAKTGSFNANRLLLEDDDSGLGVYITTNTSTFNRVSASELTIQGATSDDILLGDGTTTSLSSITSSIPAAQIQSDWNQTTTTAADYIKNKPKHYSETNGTVEISINDESTDLPISQLHIDESVCSFENNFDTSIDLGGKSSVECSFTGVELGYKFDNDESTVTLGADGFKYNNNQIATTNLIPDAQIQSDWNQTTTTAKDYIKNKPTLTTVTFRQW